MGRRWSTEQRDVQAALIHEWQPWRASTGPKSAAGKARVSQNTTKHGMRSRQAQAMRAALAGLLDGVDGALTGEEK